MAARPVSGTLVIVSCGICLICITVIQPLPVSYTVLPVSLESFTAKLDGNSVKLAWHTKSETNNRDYTVLRSIDGQHFTTIGTIEGKGTTQQASDYSFHDRSPVIGTNYYKLLQTDYNGTPNEIGIREVGLSLANEKLSLYPNPATETVTVRFTGAEKLELIDLNGRVLQTAKVGRTTTSHSFHVASLPSGTYLIRLFGAGETSTVKFIKK